MSIDPKEMNTRLWAEWKNGMKIMAESLLKDSGDLCFSGCTIYLGNENFIQRAVMYLQRKSYIGKFKDYKTRISAYETTVMELIDQVNKMLVEKITYRSTLADIIIDGDDRLENAEWGDHAMEAFGKLSDYLANIMNILEMAQKEIKISDVAEQDKYDMIIGAVASHYGVTKEQILSPDSAQPVEIARQVAMYITRAYKSEPFTAIAEAFKRNSTTVIYGVTAVKKRLESEPEFRKEIEEIVAPVLKS